jgi:hypothetical protein
MKCDPSFAFSFYLRNKTDFNQFYEMMKRGKEKFQKEWPFSLIDEKWMSKRKQLVQ